MQNTVPPELLDNIRRAISVLSDPASFPREQLESAFKFVEDVKSTSPCLFEIGLELSCKVNATDDVNLQLQTIHYGLLLITHELRFRWNPLQVPPQRKQFVIQSLLDKILVIPPNLISREHKNHAIIVENIAKIIVELAKFEWPNYWNDMTDRLCGLVDGNYESCTSRIVLISICRLAEDIAGYDETLSARRKRELNSAFQVWAENGLHMWLLGVLRKHQDGCASNGNSLTMNNSLSIAELSLDGIIGVVDMLRMPSKDVVQALLSTLYDLLSDKRLRCRSVSCLSILVKKNPPKNEDVFCSKKDLLLVLLQEKPLQCVTNAMNEAASDVNCSDSSLVELTELLVLYGSSLTSVWPHLDPVKRVDERDTIVRCLNAILVVLEQPRDTLAYLTFDLWGKLLKNESSRALLFEDKSTAILLRLMTSLRIKCRRYNPSTPSTVDDRQRFETDDDYLSFRLKLRSGCNQLFRKAAEVLPALTLQFLTDWMCIVSEELAAHAYIVNNVQSERTPCACGDLGFESNCLVLGDIEALTGVILVTVKPLSEAVANMVNNGRSSPSSVAAKKCMLDDIEKLKQQIENLLRLEEDLYKLPLVITSLLEGMVQFLAVLPASDKSLIVTEKSSLLYKTTTMLFTAISKSDSFAARLPEWQKLKCLCCAIFIEATKHFAQRFAPCFKDFLAIIATLAENSILQVEFMMLVEGMVVVNNYIPSDVDRISFLRELIEPYYVVYAQNFEQMVNGQVEPTVRRSTLNYRHSVVAMADFLGVAHCSRTAFTKQEHVVARTVMKSFTRLPVSVLRRVAVPLDSREVTHTMADMSAAMLTKLVDFCRMYWPLWAVTDVIDSSFVPFDGGLIHPECLPLMFIPDQDRKQLLGCILVCKQVDGCTSTSPEYQAQQALQYACTTSLQAFGLVATCFKQSVYFETSLRNMILSFFEMLLSPTCSTERPLLHQLSLSNLKLVMRHALRQLVGSLPGAGTCRSAIGQDEPMIEEVMKMVLPSLLSIIQHVYSITYEAWVKCCSPGNGGRDDNDRKDDSDEDADESEIVVRELSRNLTSELILIVQSLLMVTVQTHKQAMEANNEANDMQEDMQDGNNDTSSKHQSAHGGNGGGSLQLSELGRRLLVPAQRPLWQMCLAINVTALTWPDSVSSVRASQALLVLLPAAIERSLLSEGELIKIFDNILLAVKMSAPKEPKRTEAIKLAFAFYELTYETIAGMRSVLVERAQIDEITLQDYHSFLAQVAASSMKEATRLAVSPSTVPKQRKQQENSKKKSFHMFVQLLSGLYSGCSASPYSQARRNLFANSLPTLWQKPKSVRQDSDILSSAKNGDDNQLNILFQAT